MNKCAIALLFSALILASCATASENPPARLPAPDPHPPLQERGDLATSEERFNDVVVEFCKEKARMAVVSFAARESGTTEEAILEKAKKIQNSELSRAVKIDFERMIRDIFRKNNNGTYKIPSEQPYINNFSTVEFHSCVASFVEEQPCGIQASNLVRGETQCVER